MSFPPFNATGFATSSSTATIGPGVKVLDIDTTTITLPDGFIAQAVADGAAECWMLGEIRVTGPAQIELLVGSTEDSDYSGSGDLYLKTIAAFAVDSASSDVKPIDSSTPGAAILPATAGKWAALQSNGSDWVIMAQG